MNKELFDYPKQDAAGVTCTATAWAKVPAPLSQTEKPKQFKQLKLL